MIDIKRDFEFSLEQAWRIVRRFWYLLLGGAILGLVGALIYFYSVKPLYKAQLRFFTWNQTVADAAREIGTQPDAERSKTQEVIMYNNLISQSMIIGQSLVTDYKALLENPSVTEKVREKLGPKANYKLSISANRQSCIIIIEAVSPSPEIAQLAANSTMEAFLEEQLRLMGVKFASTIQEAKLPSSSFFPSVRRIFPWGIMIGLLIGAGLALLLEYLDFSLKSPEDVEALGVLYLGGISKRGDMDQHLNLSADADDRHRRITSDELAVIKTNLYHRNIENPQRSILITSDAPGVGKSTTAILLAQTLADADNRVLLIDADLRKPSLFHKLQLLPEHGLVDCLLSLAKEGDPAGFIVPTAFPDVDFMSHGQQPRRPTDFFESKQFPALLEQLKNRYRYVIIDSPPAQNMADALLIAHRVDGVICVAKCGNSRIDHYRRLLRNWEPVKTKILGAILNQQPNPFNSYYYYGQEEHDREK